MSISSTAESNHRSARKRAGLHRNGTTQNLRLIMTQIPRRVSIRCIRVISGRTPMPGQDADFGDSHFSRPT